MDILLAEADTELAASYRRFLARHGFAVTTADAGVDCLTLLRHWFPAVLALDLDLPWGGADAVLLHLREQRSHQRPPAVILTGQVPEERLPAAILASPVVKYLCKPLCLGDLLESIRGCMPGTEEERLQKSQREART
jgi:DNA-binding response OmpR family regulator